MVYSNLEARDRIIRAKECVHLTGLSRVTIWRREREGKFPKRVKISDGAVGWHLFEVEQWIENLTRIDLKEDDAAKSIPPAPAVERRRDSGT